MRLYIPYFFILFILLPGSRLVAQPYKSIFDNTSWSVRVSPVTTSNATHSIVGDSTINDIVYKKLYHDYPNHVIQGLLREDVATGKVWYRSLNDSSGTDELVMDMSLQKGDTFRLSLNPRHTLYVDSVYTVNDRKHIQFNHVYASNGATHFKFTFIEGIGTSYGLGYKDVIYNFNQYLFCAFTAHHKVYSTPFNLQMFRGDCYSTLSIEEIKNVPSKDIFVYADLSRNILRLTIPGNDKAYPYSIVNTLGQVMITAKSAPNIQQDIDISQLSPGTYLFYLIRDNKKVAVNRFTK